MNRAGKRKQTEIWLREGLGKKLQLRWRKKSGQCCFLFRHFEMD